MRTNHFANGCTRCCNNSCAHEHIRYARPHLRSTFSWLSQRARIVATHGGCWHADSQPRGYLHVSQLRAAEVVESLSRTAEVVESLSRAAEIVESASSSFTSSTTPSRPLHCALRFTHLHMTARTHNSYDWRLSSSAPDQARMTRQMRSRQQPRNACTAKQDHETRPRSCGTLIEDGHNV